MQNYCERECIRMKSSVFCQLQPSQLTPLFILFVRMQINVMMEPFKWIFFPSHTHNLWS